MVLITASPSQVLGQGLAVKNTNWAISLGLMFDALGPRHIDIATHWIVPLIGRRWCEL